MQLKHPEASQLAQLTVHLFKNKEFLMGKMNKEEIHKNNNH